MTLFELIDAHSPKVALQFSGGRDSLAMLLALREYWSKVTVYYVDSGDAFPETLDLVKAVELNVPNFVRVKGDSPGVREEFGVPSDLLTPNVGWSHLIKDPALSVKMQSRYDCCYRSIMSPMHERMKQDGITLILRGQKLCDVPQVQLRDGEVVDGFTLAFPLANWTVQEVEDYIVSQGMPVPPYYAEGAHSGPDCLHCTAWLEHNAAPYLRKHHPEAASWVASRLREMEGEIIPILGRFAAVQEQLNG